MSGDEANGVGRVVCLPHAETPDDEPRIGGLEGELLSLLRDGQRQQAALLTEIRDQLGKQAEAIAKLQITPRLVLVIALALGILGAALGAKVAIDMGGLTVQAEPAP